MLDWKVMSYFIKSYHVMAWFQKYSTKFTKPETCCLHLQQCHGSYCVYIVCTFWFKVDHLQGNKHCSALCTLHHNALSVSHTVM